MCKKKMSNRGVIYFKYSGLFYILEDENAILISYLFDIKLKRNIAYISKDKINKILLVLDKLNINYFYLNSCHEFIDNKYDYYLEYAYKKHYINNIINEVYYGR